MSDINPISSGTFVILLQIAIILFQTGFTNSCSIYYEGDIKFRASCSNFNQHNQPLTCDATEISGWLSKTGDMTRVQCDVKSEIRSNDDNNSEPHQSKIDNDKFDKTLPKISAIQDAARKLEHGRVGDINQALVAREHVDEILDSHLIPNPNTGDVAEFLTTVDQSAKIDDIPGSPSNFNTERELHVNDGIQQTQIIQYILALFAIDGYVDENVLNISEIILKCVITLCVVVYFLKNGITDYYIQNGGIQNQGVHHYPTPYRRVVNDIECKFSSFNNGILMIVLQIAIFSYVSSALTFTPFHESDNPYFENGSPLL